MDVEADRLASCQPGSAGTAPNRVMQAFRKSAAGEGNGPTSGQLGASMAPAISTSTDWKTRLENRQENAAMTFAKPAGDVGMIDLLSRSGNPP